MCVILRGHNRDGLPTASGGRVHSVRPGEPWTMQGTHQMDDDQQQQPEHQGRPRRTPLHSVAAHHTDHTLKVVDQLHNATQGFTYVPSEKARLTRPLHAPVAPDRGRLKETAIPSCGGRQASPPPLADTGQEPPTYPLRSRGHGETDTEPSIRSTLSTTTATKRSSTSPRAPRTSGRHLLPWASTSTTPSATTSTTSTCCVTRGTRSASAPTPAWTTSPVSPSPPDSEAVAAEISKLAAAMPAA